MPTNDTNVTLAPDVLEDLAEYLALAEFDLCRRAEYGDMAATRRDRELNRRARALIDAGVRGDATGHFPAVDRDALLAAWDRVVEPRRRRFEREPGAQQGTRESAGTRRGYARARRRIETGELASASSSHRAELAEVAA